MLCRLWQWKTSQETCWPDWRQFAIQPGHSNKKAPHAQYDQIDAGSIDLAQAKHGILMHITPVNTEAAYRLTLAQIAALVEADPEPGTAEGDRLDVLVALVLAYEAKHHRIDPPDPIEAIRFRMEQQGLSVKDLEQIIGKSNRVYEVLSGKRSLTLAMIRRLHLHLGIPAQVLIAERS